MKGSKLAVMFILCALLIAGIACGGTSESPTPTPTKAPTATPSAHEVNVNASNSGGQVNISVGDFLVITLNSSPTTGFSWNLSEISAPIVITKVSNYYASYPPPTNFHLPAGGGAGFENWSFQALSVGTAAIYMKYIRPWETSAEPAANFSITVNVK